MSGDRSGWYADAGGRWVSIAARTREDFVAEVEKHIASGGSVTPHSPDVELTPRTRLRLVVRLLGECLTMYTFGFEALGNVEYCSKLLSKARRQLEEARASSPNPASVKRAAGLLSWVTKLIEGASHCQHTEREARP